MDLDRVLFFLHQFAEGADTPLRRRHIIETFVNSVYVFDDYLRLVINNVEGNLRIPLSDLPPDPSSDNDAKGSPTVLHPNSRITIYLIAI